MCTNFLILNIINVGLIHSTMSRNKILEKQAEADSRPLDEMWFPHPRKLG